MPKEFWAQAGKVAAGGILDNIMRQQQASGARLKINAPSTREAKRAKGRPNMSLIDEKHRFVRGNSWGVKHFLANSEGVIVGPLNSELAQLVRYAAQKGYTGYIGLSAKTRAAIGALLRQWLQRIIRQASRRR